jgi:hypothetical protein
MTDRTEAQGLRAALIALIDASEAPCPSSDHGADAQKAWAKRRADALSAGHKALAAAPSHPSDAPQAQPAAAVQATCSLCQGSGALSPTRACLCAWAPPAATPHPTGEPQAQPEPDSACVICPECSHQFRAIPCDVQRLMLDAGFEPPFTAPPAQAEAQVDADRYRLLRRGQHWSVIDGIGNTLRAEQLDAAIDAARAKDKTQ